MCSVMNCLTRACHPLRSIRIMADDIEMIDLSGDHSPFGRKAKILSVSDGPRGPPGRGNMPPQIYRDEGSIIHSGLVRIGTCDTSVRFTGGSPGAYYPSIVMCFSSGGGRGPDPYWCRVLWAAWGPSTPQTNCEQLVGCIGVLAGST